MHVALFLTVPDHAGAHKGRLGHTHACIVRHAYSPARAPWLQTRQRLRLDATAGPMPVPQVRHTGQHAGSIAWLLAAGPADAGVQPCAHLRGGWLVAAQVALRHAVCSVPVRQCARRPPQPDRTFGHRHPLLCAQDPALAAAAEPAPAASATKAEPEAPVDAAPSASAPAASVEPAAKPEAEASKAKAKVGLEFRPRQRFVPCCGMHDAALCGMALAHLRGCTQLLRT